MTGQGKTAIDIVLAESIKELSKNYPIEKITIKEITDKAGVIRPTFYNHFQDKYKLIEWIITNELLLPMHPLIEANMITEAMVLLFTNIEKDKAFYTRAVKLEGPITFHSIAMKCVKQELLGIIDSRISGKVQKHIWLSPEVIATYFAQSMCYVPEEWLTQGMIVPPKEMAQAYNYIVYHSFDDVINEM